MEDLRAKVDELAAWDRLLSMRTQQDADDFIDPILRDASPAEYRVVKLAFMGDVLTAAYGKPGTMAQRGPRGTEPTASGSHIGGGRVVHGKAYNMMELADSAHDAATRRTKTSASSRLAGKKKQVPPLKDRLEYIQHCVGLDTLPIVSVRHAAKMADWEAVTPGQYKYEAKRRQMTLNDVHVWENFLEIMTTNPSLEFTDEENPVPNPMCGKNFVEGMFAFDKDLKVPFEEQIIGLQRLQRISAMRYADKGVLTNVTYVRAVYRNFRPSTLGSCA